MLEFEFPAEDRRVYLSLSSQWNWTKLWNYVRYETAPTFDETSLSFVYAIPVKEA